MMVCRIAKRYAFDVINRPSLMAVMPNLPQPSCQNWNVVGIYNQLGNEAFRACQPPHAKLVFAASG